MTGLQTRGLVVTWLSAGLLFVGCAGGGNISGTSSGEPKADTQMTPLDAATFPPGSVPAVLAADGRFETFLRIVSEHAPATLVFMRDGFNNHTLFAPTDEALAAVPPRRLESLLEEDNLIDLLEVIRSHVVPLRLERADFRTRLLRSAFGASVLQMTVEGGTVRIDGAEVIETDVEASPGTIHVIDRVLGLD